MLCRTSAERPTRCGKPARWRRGPLSFSGGVRAYRNAEPFHAAATAALAAGNPAGARERAAQARRMFRAHSRPHWEARASLVLTEARYALGEHSAALFWYAEQVADRLDA